MQHNFMAKPTQAQTIPTQRYLTFNMASVDEVFPGFMQGDFAVLYGSPSVISLSSLLCVRAQLPTQLGGLGTDVVFVDGGITFRLYSIARLAQLHHLNPEGVLEHIFISRAFTAYQLASLIMERLDETVKSYNARVVVVSDLAGFFLDKGVAVEEAQTVYSHIVSYLANFAKEHQIVLIATYLPYEGTKRNMTLQEMTFNRANVVLRFTKTPYAKEVTLEKHPVYRLGTAQLSSENPTLTDFMG